MPTVVNDWTHPTVADFAQEEDPVEEIREKVRNLVLEAVDNGWSGPPYDPLELADILGLTVVATEDVRDARVMIGEGGKPQIEYNPNRSLGRRRFSLAHEIAHTLFPDDLERARFRDGEEERRSDEWQLEMLCNVAAAEILMPFEGFRDINDEYLNIRNVLKIRDMYDVSTEAVLIRIARLADFPCASFAASRVTEGDGQSRYRLDYYVASRSWSYELERHVLLPNESLVNECKAIGYTVTGNEEWDGQEVHVEAVAIPSYPGQRYPRVVGTLSPTSGVPNAEPCIRKVYGDALEPHGEGNRIIAHVVNDATENWGGNGFAVALKNRWQEVQNSFRAWVEESRDRLKLGNVHYHRLDADLFVASMVAQKGYGPSPQPRIQYRPLRQCLKDVAEYAENIGATVHMPRIGCGHGGGTWSIVEDTIRDALCVHEISVTVYDLPEEPFEEDREQHSQLGFDL